MDAATEAVADGGFPMAAPPGLTPELVPALFRDRLARLDRGWPTVGDYTEFFVASTAAVRQALDPAGIFNPERADRMGRAQPHMVGPCRVRWWLICCGR